MNPTRVILADDHPVIRTGIRALLERSSDITVVAEACNGLEALDLVQREAADVLVLDMAMPGANGVEVTREVSASGRPIRILALSAYNHEKFVSEILAHGASGYLVKDEAPELIVDAVRGVARGEEGWLSRRVAAQVIRQRTVERQAETRSLETLSAREREVMELVAQGYDNQQVADMLHICDGTVKNHVTNIYSKLQVRTRAEAVAWAWNNGLVRMVEVNQPYADQ